MEKNLNLLEEAAAKVGGTILEASDGMGLIQKGIFVWPFLYKFRKGELYKLTNFTRANFASGYATMTLEEQAEQGRHELARYAEDKAPWRLNNQVDVRGWASPFNAIV